MKLDKATVSALCGGAAEAGQRAEAAWRQGMRGNALTILSAAREELHARRPASEVIRLPDTDMSLERMMAIGDPPAQMLRISQAMIALLYQEFTYRYLFMGQGRASLALLHDALEEAERYGQAASLLLLATEPFDSMLELGFLLEPVYEDALKRLYLHESLFADNLVGSAEMREETDWLEHRFRMTDCVSTRFRIRFDKDMDNAWTQSASLCMAVTDCVLDTLENRRPEKREGSIWFSRLVWACSLMGNLLSQLQGNEQPAWLDEMIDPWVNHALFIVDLNTMPGYKLIAPIKCLKDCFKGIPAVAARPGAEHISVFLESRKTHSLFSRLFRR